MGMKGFFKDVLDGKVRDVRKWIEKGTHVGLYDEYGNSALHLAAEKGYRGVCKVLIDGGADVNQKNDSVGWTAVHYAAYEGHGDVLRMLIAHGAMPDVLDNSGDTAESYAKEWENMECLKILQEAVAVREARSRQKATKSSSDEMFDSDDKTASDDSEEEDDSLSMMNWVIPPPSMPSKTLIVNQTNLVNNLVNNQFAKTVENLTIDNTVDNLQNNSKLIIVKVHEEDTKLMNNTNVTGFNKSAKKEDNFENEMNQACKESKREYMRQSESQESERDLLPDFNVENVSGEHIDEKSTSLTFVSKFDDEDTESEDTLRLIKKSEDIIITRETTPSKLRTSSIVDRIKSSLSPAPTPAAERKTKECMNEKGQPDIDKFLDFSIGEVDYRQTTRKMQNIQEEKSLDQDITALSVNQQTKKNETKLETEKPLTRPRSQSREHGRSREKGPAMQNEVQSRRERSVARALSQAKEIIARERSATRAASQTKDANGGRRKSQVRELTIPRELVPLADHIFSMSSATIPDDMTMSCGSIFERFGDLEGGESEKELLLKRLKELIDGEGNQIKEDLESRKKQLADVEETHNNNMGKVTANHQREEEEMNRRHKQEKETMKTRHSAEEERIQREIAKLDEELESILAPSQLLSSLTSRQKSSSVTKIAPAKPELTELEQELECCCCGKVCSPPTKIYQCPEGDLICEVCRGGAGARLETCPTCKVELAGMVSRNKVLENIAKKYFIGK